MNNITLVLKEPFVRCYLFDAYPLSIMAQSDDYLPWFYSNYIQISAFMDRFYDNQITIDFFERRQALKSPWLTTELLSWTSLTGETKDIISFIMDNLQRGYYFYGLIDEFYIPHRAAYNSYQNIQDILVNGYNYSEKTFEIVGYDEQMLYTGSKVGFLEFEKAFQGNNRDKSKYYWEDPVYLCKYNPNGSFLFDLVPIQELLTDYLYSRNSYERLNIPTLLANRVFGMEIYQQLKIYLESVLHNKAVCDIRTFFLLWEHKKVLLSRIGFLGERKYISNYENLFLQYQSIERRFKNFVDLTLKYHITGQERIIQRILQSLDSIVSDEYKVLEELLFQTQLSRSDVYAVKSSD